MNGLSKIILLWLIVPVCFSSELRFSHIKNLDIEPKGIITSIAEDSTGFKWVASKTQVFRFDGYEYKNIIRIFNFPKAFSKIETINFFHIAKNGDFWIGTQLNGVFHISQQGINHYSIDSSLAHQKIPNNDILGIHDLDNGDVWLASSNKLIEIKLGVLEQKPKIHEYPPNTSVLIKKISYSQEFGLLIGSNVKLIAFQPENKKFTTIQYDKLENLSFIWDIHLDQKHNLWISTANGLYLKTPGLSWQSFKHDELTQTIKSIESDNTSLWLGTSIYGLIQVNLNDLSIIHYRNSPSNPRSLLTNEITRVLLDKSMTLWVTHFDGRISFTNLNYLKFGLDFGREKNDCFGSKVIYSMIQDVSKQFWILTQNELVRLNEQFTQCKSFKLNMGSEAVPTKVYEDDNTIWLASTYGLHLLNTVDNPYEFTHFPFENGHILFVESYDSNQQLVGTAQGLFLFQKQSGEFKKINANKEVLTNSLFHSATYTDRGFLLSSNNGLLWLVDGVLSGAEVLQNLIQSKDVLNVSVDQQNNLWIGTNRGGLFKILENNDLIVFNETHGIPRKTSIRSIIHTKSNESWIATDTGLYQYKPKEDKFHQYHESDGLQSKVFNGSSMQASDGRIFFGGRFGYNAFYPGDIRTNSQPPEVAITEITRFNKRLNVESFNEAFSFDQDINLMKKITLTYEDYVIGFEFAALDYADPSRNKYAYQLEGFDPDWNYVDANNRNATYTNLPRGDYTFRVKASNKDGIWNEEGKSLKVRVLPAPWLTWWAISLYVLSVLMLAFWLVSRKLQADRRLAKILRVEVKEKTHELQLQKQTVESLLAKKNELFSNVSHEFRTPLTLILGPITQLIDESQNHHHGQEALKMVKRNANRLLSLVEQLLQLAKTSNFEKVRFFAQRADQQISAIVDSFQHLARQKKIELTLLHNDTATINATEQSLDAILGNLLSNAIKYTKNGGKVVVSSVQKDKILTLSVQDNGAGISEQQKSEVFKRFKRLDEHMDIEGIGIGLSVVEELVKINDGKVTIESTVGEGSEFIVTLPVVETSISTKPQNHSTLIQQLTQESEPEGLTQISNVLENNNKEVVLVIEDNHDMRNHIVSVLEANYHCLQAQNGKVGVANAIKYVPDLIVCDVMMPEMDGFKVSRIIRSDQRTSHIPLVLLTALNDRANRIKGWRENIDTYMTKPFDRKELLIQIENIITIRNILKKKNHVSIAKNKSNSHSDLPKKDLEFVEKLLGIIKNNYHNPQLNRAKIASKMAVSDRQLQRKIKALIDQNPMDMLREYRLKKAAERLKDGYQVAQCSDEVGFKTPTHFSQCFKAQYGFTPKIYQQQFSKNLKD